MPPLARNLIFSQPTMKIRMYRDNTDTSQAVYGLGAVNRICREMGVKLVVRAHNPLQNGICWIGTRHKLISLWSAPAKNSNKVYPNPRAFQGAVINISSDFEIQVYTLQKQKQVEKSDETLRGENLLL
ncbi:hypothetical protein DICVIV_11056 [Dictyocaulus viviparus]|uniref:Serine/threonine specific protein phosphatases domain-containing protein n=1 Tax=Dictyocaulus viviparus TaxID=29172 RepID=A0A0D8XEC8_DICVI|nr:hypothetical protein DICVIV_11056 [Dictyocaulus viviparus]